jgi:hypothetical protein
MISLHDHTAPLACAPAPSTQPPRDWRGWSGGGVRVLGYAGASHFFDPARRCHLWLVALATGETALRSSHYLETVATA